jgi:hypothetical protein
MFKHGILNKSYSVNSKAIHFLNQLYLYDLLISYTYTIYSVHYLLCT